MGEGKKCIAFVISHPYVDALACFQEPIRLLAHEAWSVDLYSTHSFGHPIPTFLQENIRLYFVEMTKLGTLRLIQRLVTHRPKYRWIFTVPQWSLYYSGMAASLANIPMVYISDEIIAEAELTTPEQKEWKERERRVHGKCSLTIALSQERADFIREENQLRKDHPIFVIPNSYAGPAHKQASHYYQDLLGIPGDKRIILHAGSLSWAPALELAENARRWKGDWFLVFQGRLLEQIRNKQNGPNVRFNKTVLSYDMLNYAVSSAHIGLGLYEDKKVNDRLMGTASGKINLYLKNAMPVITLKQKCFDWIEKEGCGVRVENLEDIPHAAEYIWTGYDRYVNNVRQFYAETLDFQKNFQPVLLDFLNKDG